MKKKLWTTALLCAMLMGIGTGCSSEIDQNAGVSEEEVSQGAALESEAETPVETEPEETEPTEPPLTARAKKLLKQNPDTVGYLRIPQTDVDNPIVQTSDNDYYLSIGFDGQEYRAGTVFLDFRDIWSWQEDKNSENQVLYGHNMADNSMFGSLRRYRQDLNFYKESPFVYYSSNYQDYTYVLFGLVITSGDAVPPNDDLYADVMQWEGFPYWNMEELDDKKHFDYYVNTIQKMNMVETPIDVKFGDQLLTLSTCYSDEDNSRFILVARRLRDGETEEELLAKINGTAPEETTEETTAAE